MSTAAATAPSRSGVNISVQQLRHVYKGGTVALDGVDLDFGTGLFGLLGPNGAGKSTLMKIMCTLLVPTSGTVSVGGYSVTGNRREVRAMLGYLPQEFGAWRLQRVEEVLDTLARLAGLRDRAGRRARVLAVLEQVGLLEVADRKVKKLSGGMVRRLGVAQALVHEPTVIVVDEPTVGLDPEERLRFRQVMGNLAKDRTIVLSTHIVADLGSSCNDLALIDAGKIEFRGSPADLIERAKGQVFEVRFPADQKPQLDAGIEIVTQSRDAEGTRVRAVAAAANLPDAAVPVEQPTLEEAYLAFMSARGRADAAVTQEAS